MKIIQKARRCGKTYDMIQWLKKNEDAALITFSAVERDKLRKEYPKLKNRIFNYLAIDKLKGRGFKTIGIDNLEIVLYGIFSLPVKIVTINKGEE